MKNIILNEQEVAFIQQLLMESIHPKRPMQEVFSIVQELGNRMNKLDKEENQ